MGGNRGAVVDIQIGSCREPSVVCFVRFRSIRHTTALAPTPSDSYLWLQFLFNGRARGFGDSGEYWYSVPASTPSSLGGGTARSRRRGTSLDAMAGSLR